MEVRDLGAIIMMAPPPPPPPPPIVQMAEVPSQQMPSTWQEEQHPRNPDGTFANKPDDPPPTPKRVPFDEEEPANKRLNDFATRVHSMLGRLGIKVPVAEISTMPRERLNLVGGAQRPGESVGAVAFPNQIIISDDLAKTMERMEKKLATKSRFQLWGVFPNEEEKDALRIMVHEYLHQVTGTKEWAEGLRSGSFDRFLDGGQTEEGIVEAATFDVLNIWGRKFGASFPIDPPGVLYIRDPDSKAPPTYRDRAVEIRKLSMRWTGRPWTSPQARRWRMQFLHADFLKRKDMIARAQQRPMPRPIKKRRRRVDLAEVSIRSYIRDGKLVRAHRRRMTGLRAAALVQKALPPPGEVKIRRAGTPEEEKVRYAAARLADLYVLKPGDLQTQFLTSSWETLRGFMDQLWREKANPAHELLPEEFRPGGKYRAPFRAAINPATIDRMDYILTEGRNRAAEALERSLSGEVIEVERSGRVPMLGPGFTLGKGRKMSIDLAERARYWSEFYEESRAEVRRYSAEYGVSEEAVVAIISAISPSTVWEARDKDGNRLPWDNMESARLVIEDLARYGEVRPENKATWVTEHRDTMGKIRTIWDERDVPMEQKSTDYLNPLAVYFGTTPDLRKTINFAQNIYGDDGAVTIDRHMYNLMSEYPEGVVRNGWEYDAMEQVVRSLSDESGIDPATVQAILWGWQREVRNRQQENEMVARRTEERERLKEAYPALRKGRWANVIANVIAKRPPRRRRISSGDREKIAKEIMERFGIAPEMVRPQIAVLSERSDLGDLLEEALGRLRAPESDIWDMREALIDISILVAMAKASAPELVEDDGDALVMATRAPVTDTSRAIVLGEIEIPSLPRKITRGLLARIIPGASDATLAYLRAEMAEAGSSARLELVEAEIARRDVVGAFFGPSPDWREWLYRRDARGRFAKKATSAMRNKLDELVDPSEVKMSERPNPTMSKMRMLEEARGRGSVMNYGARDAMDAAIRVHGGFPFYMEQFRFDWGDEDQSIFMPGRAPDGDGRGVENPYITMHPYIVFPDMYGMDPDGDAEFDTIVERGNGARRIIFLHEMGHHLDKELFPYETGLYSKYTIGNASFAFTLAAAAVVSADKDDDGEMLEKQTRALADIILKAPKPAIEQIAALHDLDLTDFEDEIDAAGHAAEIAELAMSRALNSRVARVYRAIMKSEWGQRAQNAISSSWVAMNLEPLIEASGDSEEMRTRFAAVNGIVKHAQYHFDPAEMWAQTYPRFIAEYYEREYGDSSLKRAGEEFANESAQGANALMRMLGADQSLIGFYEYLFGRWQTDEDFAPVYEEVKQLFEDLGMLPGLPPPGQSWNWHITEEYVPYRDDDLRTVAA